jgi:cytochrome P450
MPGTINNGAAEDAVGHTEILPQGAEPNAEFFAWLQRMRDTEPVSFDPTTGLWSVFGREEAVQVMTSPDVFVNDLSSLTPPQEDYDVFFKGNIAAMDEPRHRKFRQLVQKVFSARYIAGLEEKLTGIATGLVDSITGQERFDIAASLAFPFPVTVIADILGADLEDTDKFAAWAELLHVGSNSLDGLNNAAKHLKSLNAYIFDLIDKRRVEPRDDLISLLIAAELEGHKLADDEIVGFAGVLLMGGITTTAALISNIVLTFDQHPDLWARVRADRTLVPKAIEEVVRMRPSFSSFLRMAAEDTELGGEFVPGGSIMKIWVSSANRDAAHWQDPDVFDIDRESNRHNGFGQGIHFCIGAPLARLESRIAFNLLLDRFTELKVDHDRPITFLDTNDMIGATQLPVVTVPA